MSTTGRRDRVPLHDERRTRGRAPRAAQNPQKETRSGSLGWMRPRPPLSTWLLDLRAGFCEFCVRLRILRSAVLALRDVYDRTSRSRTAARRTQNTQDRSARGAESAERTQASSWRQLAAAGALGSSRLPTGCRPRDGSIQRIIPEPLHLSLHEVLANSRRERRKLAIRRDRNPLDLPMMITDEPDMP